MDTINLYWVNQVIAVKYWIVDELNINLFILDPRKTFINPPRVPTVEDLKISHYHLHFIFTSQTLDFVESVLRS